MKKIVVAFNAINYSSSLSAFAINIAKQTDSLLNAVFLTRSLAPVVQYPFLNDLPLASTGLVSTVEMEEENRKMIDSHIGFFQDDCERENVRCKIDNTPGMTLDDLIDLSAFSDLVLCDAKEEIGGVATRELLADTHCPVILVPAKMNMPSKTVLCYDESFSSILALKMYSYLFPEWKEFPTTVLSINPKGDNGLRFDDYLNDWLPLHFSNLDKKILQGNLQRELVSYIRQNEPAMVVMGAYGGNAVSRMFHRSLANIVVEETEAFLFIMHE